MRRGTRTAQPVVAEVALELTGDRRRGERRELEPAVGFEALDRLEQADERDLAEVVGGLAAVREAAGEELGEAHVLLHELVAQRAVAGAAVLGELLVGVDGVGHSCTVSDVRLLHHRETDLVVALDDLVEIRDRVDDRPRQVAERRERDSAATGNRAACQCAATDDTERQRDLVVARRHQQVAQLVDRDAEVLDLVVVEPSPAGGVGGHEPHGAQVLREGRAPRATRPRPRSCRSSWIPAFMP